MTATVIRGLLILLIGIGSASFAARPAAKIDNTTLESFRASWQQLNSRLSSSQRLQLQFAVVQIAMAGYNSATEVPDTLKSIGPETIRDKIDGMTYADIMRLADKSAVKVETLKPCGSRSGATGPCTK